MARSISILWAICLLCGTTIAGDPDKSAAKWAVGYDEGLSGKYEITQKWSANISVGYNVVGADSAYKQPLNTALAKIGCQFIITEFNRLHIGAFVDLVETMKEEELAYMTMVGPDAVFYQWNTSGRIGLAPEFFLTDHFSLTYKFGVAVNYFGNTYKLNADESGIETKDNSYITGGVYGYQSNSPFMLLQNIALYVYF
ncbi:MAG: hypothetical protein WBM07_11520 [Chitinivibrionales bacterium]